MFRINNRGEFAACLTRRASRPDCLFSQGIFTKAITSASGKWSMDENGSLVVDSVKARTASLGSLTVKNDDQSKTGNHNLRPHDWSAGVRVFGKQHA